MNRLVGIPHILGLVALMMVLPVPSPGQGSSGGSGASTPSPPRTTRPSRPQMDQTQRPLYVNGRIVMDTGKPVSESVTVELNCGIRSLQAIHTDLGGYFTFTLGAGAQSNMDFSASNQSPMGLGNPQDIFSRQYGNSLAGCELRIAVPGYHPLNYTLNEHTAMGRVDVGTLRLRRIAGVEGSAISVTSLLVPKSAREEFEKALKDLQKNRSESARKRLEKAVAEYEEYAAAWNELGRIYQSSQEIEKAEKSFEKAIAADPQYIPPYMNLATLQLQNRQYQRAVETAGEVLRLDPSLGFASFLHAVGNYNLNNLEAAEKSARQAEKGPHENIPQLHALLAEISLHKQAYSQAAVEMRTYLQEAPEGQYAEQMKKTLEQVEKLTGQEEGESSAQTNPTPGAEPN